MFCCPTIGRKLRQMLAAGTAREYDRALFQGMLDGRAVESSEHFEFFNSLQVGQSHRFVFSAVEYFSLAQEMVRESPEFSLVKGRGTVAPMGQLPRRESMPSGTYLVITGGLDHLMLPAVSWSDESAGAEFEVTVLTSLIPRGLREEESFTTVSVFEDGYELQMIRGASLEFKEHGDYSTIRARFSDGAFAAALSR